MSRIQSLSFVIIAGLMLAFSGCRSLTPAVSYYTLSAIEPSSGSNVADDDRPSMVIGIRSVVLPGYLARTQMMRKTSEYRLEISPYHRWANYLDRLVQQVIEENLNTLFPHIQIVNVPWSIGLKPDFSLSIQISSLIASADRKVSLTAVWTLFRDDKSIAIGPRQIILSAPMADKGFESLAKAHSEVIAELCRQMASVINNFLEKNETITLY